MPRSHQATGALLQLVGADVHETLGKPVAGLDPAVLVAAAAGIEVADVPVPVMVVMMAVMMMAVMATVLSAVLASQSSAGSKQNKSGGDTKSSLAEH